MPTLTPEKHAVVAAQAVKAKKSLARWARATPSTSVAARSIEGACLFMNMPLSSFAWRLVRLGGAEKARLLLGIAKCDYDEEEGVISDEEHEMYLAMGKQMVADLMAHCGNVAVVCALFMTQTHGVSIRPYKVSESSAAMLDGGSDALMWIAYMANMLIEVFALLTITTAIFFRQQCLAVLPNLEAKMEFILVMNPSFLVQTMLTMTLFCFLIVIVTGSIVSNEWRGVAGSAQLIFFFLVMFFASMGASNYHSATLLHSEVQGVAGKDAAGSQKYAEGRKRVVPLSNEWYTDTDNDVVVVADGGGGD